MAHWQQLWAEAPLGGYWKQLGVRRQGPPSHALASLAETIRLAAQRRELKVKIYTKSSLNILRNMKNNLKSSTPYPPYDNTPCDIIPDDIAYITTQETQNFMIFPSKSSNLIHLSTWGTRSHRIHFHQKSLILSSKIFFSKKNICHPMDSMLVFHIFECRWILPLEFQKESETSEKSKKTCNSPRNSSSFLLKK